MRTRLGLIALFMWLALSVGVGSSPALADDSAKAEAMPVTNKVCPMTGEEVTSKFRVEYNGQYVYFCCGGCASSFKADPDAAIAKLSSDDKAAIQKNTVCPISGETIESFDTRSELDGKLVYFCCTHCKERFDKEHPATASARP